MDEWLFISLAKTKADAPGFDRKSAPEPKGEPLSKADTAAALDLAVVADKPAFRGAAAFLGAALVNAVILSAVDTSALESRTPRGEVIVAQLEPVEPVTLGAARTSVYDAAAVTLQ